MPKVAQKLQTLKVKADNCVRIISDFSSMNNLVFCSTAKEVQNNMSSDEPPTKRTKTSTQTLMDHFILPTTKNPTRKVYSCEKCHAKFNLFNNFNQHIVVCSNYSCLVCKKTFKSQENFKKHKIKNCPPKRFHCEKCPKSYARKSDCEKHKKTHVTSK